MFYYHVWVKSAKYRGNEPLTYHHDTRITIGSIVRVELRLEHVLGIVAAPVSRPGFSTKPIANVLDLPPLPQQILELAAWLQRFYPSPIGVITQQLLPRLAMRSAKHSEEDSTPAPAILPQPPLTEAQRKALEAVVLPDTYLLHGRTGSGKTRVYTELATRTVATGRSVLVLSPEIGLTSQLAARFRGLFGSHRVIVLHSQLTDIQREQTWVQILRSAAPLIVIGPRSALFSPIASLGLIVVDECHDPAYKQEQAPYYHALRVASQLRSIHRATLVLGSATPSVADYYFATEKNKAIIRLDSLAKEVPFERNVTIVDLKNRAAFNQSPHISSPLIQAITTSLGRREQVLLYLNRRGSAHIILCDQCGWQATCPRCGLPLTYHGDEYRLRCHMCGNSETIRPSCPACGNPSIIFRGIGTKAIVDEVQHLFPEARVARFDTDNKRSERLEQRYEQIMNGEVDILVGTQMLAKGLDLPRLSTLGIIMADSSLALPDYTSTERTYQLLNQVLGRIGRGHIQSHAVIQTLRPNSVLLKASLESKWDVFYNSEIQQRRRYFLPPFCSLLKLDCRRTTSDRSQKAAASLRRKLDTAQLHVEIEGPAPAFREKIGNEHHWQLIIKARQRSELLKVIELLPKSGWAYDIDPADLL